MSEDPLHPAARLLRSFAVDFLTGHGLDVPARIMAAGYTLNIGGHVLDGRDEKYLPATSEQLSRFPGLCVTAHDVVIGDRTAALRFTEHGASPRHGGTAAAWGGVAVFRIDGGKLAGCWAEEDYFGRRMQLATGECNAVEPPHPAPWDVQAADGNAATEADARAWLERGAVVSDIPPPPPTPSTQPSADELIRVERTTINELFTAGNRAAFHVEQHGSYAGGFADVDAARIGTEVVLRTAGLLTVRDGEVVAARVTSDRLGLYYSLAQS